MLGDLVPGKQLIRRIGSRVMEQTGDVHATQFLIQQVSLNVQCGKVASVMGATIPPSMAVTGQSLFLCHLCDCMVFGVGCR